MPIFTPSNEDPNGGGATGPAGWGPVPTLGSVSSAVPPTPTTPSATQEAQNATAATLAAAQSNFMPPAPVWSPMLDGNGFMTAPWVTWFQTLSRRVGGTTGNTSDDAAILGTFPELSHTTETAWDLAQLMDMANRAPVTDESAVLLADTPRPKGIDESILLLTDPPQGNHLAYWNDWNLSISGAKVPNNGAPDWKTWVGTLAAYQFAVNDSIMMESQEFLHDWKEGTAIHIHLHWTTGGLNDATPRGVKWQIEYTYANTDFSGAAAYAFPATATISAEYTIPANAADRSHIGTAIGIITPTGINIGAQIMMRLKRIAAAGTAPAANPFALSLGIHYEKDTPGSRSIATK